MLNLQDGSVHANPYRMLWVGVGCATLTVLLCSCSAELPVLREAQQADGGEQATQYSIVCVIHGDGDYLYHDSSGNEYNADEVALAEAQRVALRNPHAEVFIFHQRPRSHFLFFFPLRDGTFYYYRNGRPNAEELYWRDQEQTPFDTEVGLYRRFSAGNQPGKVSLFLYFGHEIPEFDGAGYDASYPDRPLTVQGFARGVGGFREDSSKFDIVVLSTCFGGTPYTIGALGTAARYIIASPDNLHLSYLDLRSLERMDLGFRDVDVHTFARRYARLAFDILKGQILTTVSVAVYDVDRVQKFLRAFLSVYEYTLNSVKSARQASMAAIEHCDCADLPSVVLPAMSDGVDVFYRPPRFGRAKEKQHHSGWECWRERDPIIGRKPQFDEFKGAVETFYRP